MNKETTAAAVLQCNNLSKTFTDAGSTIHVLNNINFSIAAGDLVAVVGVSGAGKSTLLHIMGGLDKPTSGDILVSGINLNQQSAAKKGEIRNHYLGFVYQFHHLLSEFNALENVAMPLLIRNLKAEEAQEQAKQILDRVGLGQRLSHRVGELSGGERQRVAIARALVTKPVCVLADEPTGNLDKKTAEQCFELILDLNREFMTSFIIVTHDMTLANRMHRVLRLENGLLVSGTPN